MSVAQWSLVSVVADGAHDPSVAALRGDRFTTVPPLSAYTDLADVVADWAVASVLLHGFDPAEAVPLRSARVLAPLRSPRKLICAGANYRDHLREMGIPDLSPDLEPYFFLLPPTSIAGPEDTVVIPDDPGARVDWEAELAVVIGRPGRDIAEDEALAHVAGYTIMNDISARGYHGRPHPLAPPFAYDWLASKGLDTFSPLGPGITPAWFVHDPQDLSVRMWRNGELEQDGNTRDMIFSVARLIAAASATMMLEPGDVIATGTPAGVGVAQGKAIGDGDALRVEIGGLGVLSNRVRTAVAVPTPVV
jgi:2-keto-4-pentenoate hydratase/2-oxohepta-3-ene-1,7-dioic acid hydratase in catechol pathway